MILILFDFFLLSSMIVLSIEYKDPHILDKHFDNIVL
jgi:hypothetical protein